MWRNLADARKQAEEQPADDLSGSDADMPEGPTVQVSDLQTMARLLVAANKTDDIMFLPSSNALKMAQKQGGGEGARARSRSSAEADAARAVAADATDGAEVGGEDDFSDPVSMEDGDEEEAGGPI